MVSDGWIDCPHCGKETRITGITQPTPVLCIECLRAFTAVPGVGYDPEAK
jgi:hypothetical protein